MSNAQLSTLLSRATTGSTLTLSGRLSALPWLFRFSFADLFTHARYGESVAVECAQRIVEMETDETARAFAVTQLRDERSHFAFFDEALGELGMERPLRQPLHGFLGLASTRRALPELLVANHLIVESLAHDLFAEIAKKLSGLTQWWVPASWRAALRDVADGMLGISRDESRHVAFGVLRLRSLREEMSVDERAQLDVLARRWFGELREVLGTMERKWLFRSTRRELARTVIERCQRRCLDAGIEVAS